MASRHSSAVRPESTYSQIGSRGEAWKSPTPSAPPGGSRPSRNSRVASAITSRVQRGERRAAREVVERERRRRPRGRGCRPGRSRSGRGQRHAGVGLGAVADEVAEAPQLVGARGSAAAITASKAWRLPWMSESRWRPAWRSVYSVPDPAAACRRCSSPRWWSRRRRVLLRPSERYRSRASGEPRAYFSAAELERAEDFRPASCGCSGCRWPSSSACSCSPCAARRAAGKRARRPAPAAAAAARSRRSHGRALPLRAARQRAKDVGLVTQGWAAGPSTSPRRPRSAAASPGAGGAAARGPDAPLPPRRWWAPGALAVVAFGVVFTYLGPVVLDPLFNKFTPLPAGDARGRARARPSAPASTWARSTRSTPRAARPPPTPT